MSRGMVWSTVISTVVGVLAGGLVNAYFSRQGSKELKREADGLRQLNLQLIRFLEDAGIIENVDWKDGKPIRIVSASATSSSSSSGTARPTVIRHDAQNVQSDKPAP